MKKNKNAVWRFLYKLHRYLGITSAIVLIMLSITGIALNHTEDLRLDSLMIESNSLLDWYGIKAPQQLQSFSTTQHWLSQINQQIFFDQAPLIKSEEKLLGAIEVDNFIVAGLSESLLLLSLDGEIIEQSPMPSLMAIGLGTNQSILIKSAQGTMFSNDGLLSWSAVKAVNHPTIYWSKTTPLPELLAQSLKNRFRSSILPLERVILDLHSGRFFGTIGVIIVDISGVFLIVLSFSGCAIWLKHTLRHYKNRR